MNTRFQPGASGNLAGRPKDPLRRHREELAAELVRQALSGDRDALRLAIERAIPIPHTTMKAGGGVKL